MEKELNEKCNHLGSYLTKLGSNLKDFLNKSYYKFVCLRM